MFIAIKTALASLKKKKVQNILIGIIIMLISTLLYIGIAMVTQSAPFETMFERANASESLLIITEDNNDIGEIIRWWEDRKEVKETLLYEASMINGEFELNGNTETETLFLTEYIIGSDIDLLYEDDKTLSETPMGNQVLINYNFAKNRNLNIGDTISFRYENAVFEFDVAGYVVDPHFSNPFINPNRCFVAPKFFEENNIKNNGSIISIKYHDINSIDDLALFEAYGSEMVDTTSPIFLDYSTIQSSYNIILGVIAAILLGVSVMILIIVIFVIRSTIHNIILQQYKQIGVKKAIGYTNKQIRNSMLAVYGLLGLISSTIGAFLGVPIRSIVNAGISYDIQVGINTTIDILLPVTILLIVSLVTLFTYLSTKKTNNIKPVQAIKYGMPERKASKSKFTINNIKNAPISLLLSIKQLLVNKGRTLTTTLLITLLIYVAMVIFNTGGTLANSDHLVSHLLGLKVGDVSVSDNSQESIKDAVDKILSIDEVSNVVYFDYKMNESTLMSDGSSLTLMGQNIFGVAPKDFIVLESGRNPNGSDEIAICTDVAKSTSKQMGDYITIQNDSGKKTYLITGTYNSISSSGNTYTILQKDIPEDLMAKGKLFWVFTDEDTVIIEDIDAKVKKLLGDQATVSKYDSNVKNILSTVSSFPVVINSLLLVFLIVSGVIILNATIMDINNSTKDYGIMKAIGCSKGLITRVLVIRTLLMTVIGTILGFIANFLSMNSVMQGIFKVTPFSSIELPVIFNAPGSFVLLVLFILIGIIGTLIPARKIGKISPKQLIAE